MMPRLSLRNVERIEFIRGPGAVVYGSYAMMGVINIVTRPGSNELARDVGSFNRKSLNWFETNRFNDYQMALFEQVESD